MKKNDEKSCPLSIGEWLNVLQTELHNYNTEKNLIVMFTVGFASIVVALLITIQLPKLDSIRKEWKKLKRR